MFEIGHDFLEDQTVVFLMNSSGEVEVIEDDNYYTVNSFQFFTEVNLEIVSGGDDEHFKASATIGELNGRTVLLSFCAAMVASSNSAADTLNMNYAKLSKWNTKTNKYEDLQLVASASEVSACEERLLADEIKNGFDIYDY